MKALIQIVSNKMFVSALALLAFAVIIWFGGPLVSIGETAILAGAVERLVTIIVVTLLWGFNNMRKQKKDDEKTEKLLGAGGLLSKIASGGKKDLSDSALAEQEKINQRFKDAMSILKKTKLNKAAGGLRLHELPWYIVIGPPGSGKTTAVVNSGLKFPLADQLGTQAIRGVGGTRDCDWWFTDEAVLIDTAGRYTSQDSNKDVDSAGWDGFLAQLKKFRKAKPINGAIITISFSELVNSNDRERIEHAQTIKERIKELREKLGIDFPIYFFFTKCDLIAGFNDFFDGFSKKEREQAWGFTFPLDSGDERNAYSRFSNEYEQLLQRLNSRVLSRMQAEKDVSKRARILAFPQELAALKPIANDFIKNVFQASRLDKAVMLRGIYMTSGTQQGTPIDRVLGSLASTFGLDQQQVPSLSGQGRSYFIHDVLSNVIFREAGLGDTKKSYQVQLSMMNKAAYAASLLVVVVAAIGWTSSFSDSEQRVADVQQYVEKYIRETRGVDTTKAMPADILPAVNALSSALELLEEDRERWFAQGGLDQSGKLGESLESAYGRVLKTLYQPSLILFLEQQLVNEANNSEQLFAALKTYLMLTDTSKLDRKTVESWLASIWPLYLAGDPTNQARLNLHTTNLLSGDYQAMLPKPSYISHARERLNSVPLAERVYARLRDNSDASKYDLKTKDWLKTASGKSFQFREGIENIPRVPGFFSHNGFHKVFLKENTLVSQSTAEEGWVLGMTETAELNEQELKDLRNNVQKLYLHDYEEVWRNLLNSLDVVKFDSIDHAVDVLDEFSSPTSPLKTLLTAVETNVSLTRLPRVETKVAALGKAADALQAVADSASKRNPDAPWRVVDENFKPIAKLADGGAAGTPPIDQTLKMIADVKATLIKVNGSPNLNEASHKLAAERVKNRGNDAIGRLRKHAQSLPAPVKGWVTALSSESWRVLLVQSKEQIRDNWVNEVYPEYERNIVRRYPLSEKSTTDVSLDDFARFFGPGGTMDTFFKNNLEPFVATRSRVWRENAIEEQDLSLNRQLIVNLQRAASIRDTFFRDNPDTPSLEFIMKPRNLDAKISRFTLELDGNQLVYRHGPTRSSKITWPGNSTNGRAKANFETTTGREYRVDKDGTWALFRLFDEARVKGGGQYDLVSATFQAKSYNAEYEVRTKGVSNPLATNVLHKFSLPKEI